MRVATDDGGFSCSEFYRAAIATGGICRKRAGVGDISTGDFNRAAITGGICGIHINGAGIEYGRISTHADQSDDTAGIIDATGLDHAFIINNIREHIGSSTSGQ